MFDASIAPSARSRADERVQLVDKEDDLTFGFLDLSKHGLETIFKFAAIFCAGEHRTEIETDETFVSQRFGHVARDDSLRQTFDDRRFADARLADQNRIVLRAARKNLDRPTNLVVASDHRIELSLACELGQIPRIF